MRIWYDACTGKHVRYGAAIAKRLEHYGHEIIFTTREHPDTIPLARHLGLNFEVVGRYDPRTLYTRLYESLRRQMIFCKMFRDKPPDIAISHCSVDQCRVAFGLKIPIISTFDTPHADAVNRLTLPLVDVLIASKAISDEFLKSCSIKRIIKFDGVDEVAWVKDFQPKQKFDYDHPLIVVRQIEIRAAYAEGKEDITLKVAKKLLKYGNVVFLSRYVKRRIKGLIVPRSFIDSASLVAEADLVVSVGGTIAREAALQGTPSIIIPVLGALEVNRYLHEKGFPIFIVNPNEVEEYVEKYLGKKFNVKERVFELENPVDIIEKVVKEIELKKK
ncbi:DUF354 domain-containing protein [Candidatus Bathyarchaeota archaeon]|nr:DUF354 domain-containing protein [Candidatus Bathyarchaeota archaeon]